jgi:hypothetical protein
VRVHYLYKRKSRHAPSSQGPSLYFESFFVNYISLIAHWCQYIKNTLHFPSLILHPRNKIYRVSDFSFWFGRSLSGSVKSKLTTSSRSGLTSLDKHMKEDSNPHFGPLGTKFSRFRIFAFDLSGPSINLQNFSFLLHLEVSYLLW